MLRHLRCFVMPAACYAGLSFNFCLEGLNNQLMGGGGNEHWLDPFLTYRGQATDGLAGLAHMAKLEAINSHLLYSWQWGNLNYPATLEIIHDLQRRHVPIVVVCSDLVTQRPDGQMPPWATAILTVPFVVGLPLLKITRTLHT
jgi:hypothetical protein